MSVGVRPDPIGRCPLHDAAALVLLTLLAHGCASPPAVARPATLSIEPWRTPKSWYTCNTGECGRDIARPLLLESEGQWSSAVIRLERQGCYGQCPEYRVSLYPDGRIEYEGEEHVGACGRRVGQVSAAKRGQLVRAFRNEHYLTANLLGESPEPQVTDQDTAVTLVELGDQRRLVWHYAPRVYGPRLARLEQLIDSVTDTPRWTACRTDGCWCQPPGQSEQRFLDQLVDSGVDR